MAMKCTSCGGMVVYNIETKKLECEFCKDTFEVKGFGSKNQAQHVSEKIDGMMVDSYRCKSCGAELNAPEEQSVAYCMYCGSEVTLMQSEEMERPKRIIPFDISKQKVREKYKDALEKKYFVPEEFKDAEFIEGFRGVYIPYWMTEYKIDDAKVALTGVKHTTQGSYDYTRYYDYTVQVGGPAEAGCYDASATFDDTIAAEIAPFDINDSVEFEEGYLAGFYSDKATTPVETYQDQMEKTVSKGIKDSIWDKSGKIETPEKEIKKAIHWEFDKADMALFPVWFLTWKKKNRVAYCVMNGKTGKMSMDVPVDYKKFFKNMGILGLVIFVVLSLLPSFIIPLNIAAYASILMFLSSVLMRAELRTIGQMEGHVFDYGYNAGDGKKKKLNKKGFSRGFGIFLSILAGLVIAFILSATGANMDVQDVKIVYLFMFYLQIGMAIRQLIRMKDVHNKMALIPIFVCIAVQLLGTIIPSQTRQQDYWYYGLAIACFIGMLANMLTSIFYINYLTTRPVPNFFTREGANNKYE